MHRYSTLPHKYLIEFHHESNMVLSAIEWPQRLPAGFSSQQSDV